MAASFALGFILVILFTKKDHLSTIQQTNRAPSTVTYPETLRSKNTPEVGDTDTGAEYEDEAERPPEVPPGKTPTGLGITGVLYLKCFGSDGTVYKGEACGTIDTFVKRFSTRLYVVDRCARQILESQPEGILSLGANVDLEKKEVGFWAGPSSTFEGAPRIGSCIRRELSGLPLYGIDGKYSQYRLFFTVEFEDPQKLAKRIKKLKRRGRVVSVVMDHVRIRHAANDGFPFGKLGIDSQVTLVKRKDDWCHVVTPNDNEGWMICDALEPFAK